MNGDSVDMSTVDPNATIDDTSYSDTSATQVSDLANAAGRWGAVITSMVTGKPLATTAAGVPIGAAGSRVINAPPATSTILILVVVGAIAVVVVVMATKKG